MKTCSMVHTFNDILLIVQPHTRCDAHTTFRSGISWCHITHRWYMIDRCFKNMPIIEKHVKLNWLCLHCTFFCWFYNLSYPLKSIQSTEVGFPGGAKTFATHSKVCNVQWVSHDHMHYYFIWWRWSKSAKSQISCVFGSFIFWIP